MSEGPFSARPRVPIQQAPAPARKPLIERAPRLRGVLAQAGGMMLLLALSLKAIFARPMTWPRDFVDECWTLIKRCTAPLSLSVFAFGFGTIGVQAGLVFQALGGADRTGQVFVTGAVRELATWATAMVVAGIGGTAICADLGARKIREELDALQVIGVDPMRSLVVPKMLAMAVVTPLLNMVAVAFCTLAGVCAVLVLYDTTISSFFATFRANFYVPELLASVTKTILFGFIIGIVCCYKGLNAKGGPQGVGRAVNQAVVISFASLWIFNYAFTSVLLASFPSLQGLR